MKPLMIQGTGSHAGKSFLATAICRIFLRRGLEVAPFKAQNMANNAAAVIGGEIGRAQALQAAACRVDPDVRMNPLLLKPSGAHKSQAVVMGRPVGTFRVREIDRRKPVWFKAARKAYRSLAAENDVVVIEGAGSPAEVNLRAVDYANMRVARMADASVLLVGDIDRGGVFASLYGTMELLRPDEKNRVIGLCINKFRGDASLLKSGIRFLRTKTGKRVLGVIPYDTGLRLPEEDSLALSWRSRPVETAARRALILGLVRTPQIANFTDYDPFQVEPDVVVRDIFSPKDLPGVSAVILPGSKNVFSDMAFLRRSGLADALAASDLPIIGVCGGLQMLGHTIVDPLGVESGRPARAEGLGLLPIDTRFYASKIVRTVERYHPASRSNVRGYEIHHGRIFPMGRGARPMFRSSEGGVEGWTTDDGRIWGTLTHGLFDADRFRNFVLNNLRRKFGLPLRPARAYDLDARIDRAADLVERHLDIDFIVRRLKA